MSDSFSLHNGCEQSQISGEHWLPWPYVSAYVFNIRTFDIVLHLCVNEIRPQEVKLVPLEEVLAIMDIVKIVRVIRHYADAGAYIIACMNDIITDAGR